MADTNDRIQELSKRIESLLQRQNSFSKEIEDLRQEILKLKYANPASEKIIISEEHAEFVTPISSNIPPIPSVSIEPNPVSTEISATPIREIRRPQKSVTEKYIGENLINKIGIAVTVIGVGIGAKYSIDHDLISPLTRIILGYLMGIALLGVGWRLKKNYENYSAVLVSGAMAIMYFMTYAAYSFYNIWPQWTAFLLMVIFTVFTVVASLRYNNQVIAIIGLVGAYAVPFLLSGNSGNTAVLFTYMAIINLGILYLAHLKYWKGLYYSSFILTWMIFCGWYFFNYEVDFHFSLSFLFLTIFFITFYGIFLTYKLLRREKFNFGDILFLLTNSFIFYGIGYSMLNDSLVTLPYLGLFTLLNALIHFAVSAIIHSQKLADRNLFFLVSGLVLIFITIAIPVQLDGNWVTLIWILEAALLFWIGRTKKAPLYEWLSYSLMFLAVISLGFDWTDFYGGSGSYAFREETSFLNIHFLTSIIFSAAAFFISKLNADEKYPVESISLRSFRPLMDLILPVMFLGVIYFAVRNEISLYFTRLYDASVIVTPAQGDNYGESFWNIDLVNFKDVWLLNYNLVFMAVLFFAKGSWMKNKFLSWGIFGLSVLLIADFLTQGLYVLGVLRDSYLSKSMAAHYVQTSFNIVIRYISIAFLALLLFAIYRFIQSMRESKTSKLFIFYELLLHLCILGVASSELISWMQIMHSDQSYKLALSILWGVYALLLIILGIWKDQKYLRIGAIILFAITLIKLFFYDISHLGTLSKTVVFVSLGILLLIISFLYNKYTHKIR